MKILSRIPADWRPILLVAAPVFVLSYVYLIALGEGFSAALMLANTLFLALLAWLTARVTRPLPPVTDAARPQRGRLGAQMAVLAVVILITLVGGERVPLWSGMVEALRGVGEAVLPVEWFGGPGNAVANPVQYFLIPLILLLALGARPGELGLGRGHRVGRAVLVWVIGPGLLLLLPALSGSLSGPLFIRRVISNFFQNGFFEEFLFRGALQTRLNLLMTPPRTLVLQALLFGLWHLRGNMAAFGGNVLGAVVWCIVSQGIIGLVLGYVFQRTRNLVAPTVAHVMLNVMGESLG